MTSTDAPTGWDRRRLLAILAAAAAGAALLATGLAYSLIHLFVPTRAATDDEAGGPGIRVGSTDPAGVAAGARRRDELAAAPMLRVPEVAARPPDGGGLEGDTHSDTRTGRISVPSGAVLGPASVLTGFPRTPEGAVGQLAQIEVTVLQAMSLPTAHQVHQAWALPGGVDAAAWAVTRSVASFLDSAGMGQVKDPAATVTADPVAAIVKGTDGPDWATACVLVTVSAVYRAEGRVAWGHCERMQWAGGRWMIAPGVPPALAPSTWPGTALARNAGWRTWTTYVGDRVGLETRTGGAPW